MDVKIFYSSATEVQPIDSHKVKTSDAFKEVKKIWKLDSNKMYKIVITHSSDMYDQSTQQTTPCAYFDLIVAINSMDSLVDAMQCQNYEETQSGSFVDFWPKELDKEDLNFSIDGFYTLRYPQDFRRSKFGLKTKNDLLFTSTLALQEPFTV